MIPPPSRRRPCEMAACKRSANAPSCPSAHQCRTGRQNNLPCGRRDKRIPPARRVRPVARAVPAISESACSSSSLARNSVGRLQPVVRVLNAGQARACPQHQFPHHHFQDRQQDTKLDRGRLHPRRAGNRHRAGGQVDFFDARVFDDFAAAFDMLAENFVRIVIDEINLGAGSPRLPRRCR